MVDPADMTDSEIRARLEAIDTERAELNRILERRRLLAEIPRQADELAGRWASLWAPDQPPALFPKAD